MKTCLVVDDSSVIRKVARRILEGLEFQIVEAEDGEQALEACRKQLPEAILLDWNMALALKKLNAENTAAFVDHVAEAGTRNLAFYHRRRAQILAARSNELGGLVSFATFGGQPINIARNGNVVAAFTVDDIAWTDVQQRTFIAATAENTADEARHHPCACDDRRGDTDG